MRQRSVMCLILCVWLESRRAMKHRFACFFVSTSDSSSSLLQSSKAFFLFFWDASAFQISKENHNLRSYFLTLRPRSRLLVYMTWVLCFFYSWSNFLTTKFVSFLTNRENSAPDSSFEALEVSDVFMKLWNPYSDFVIFW